MKGFARADGLPSADYEAVVLALSRLSNAVIANQAPGGALAAAIETGAVLLQAECGAAFVIDSTSNSIKLAACHGIDIPSSRSVLPGHAVVKQCAKSCAPVVIENLAVERRQGLSRLAKLGVASLVCVPVKAAEGCIGALMVMSREPRAFSASDVDVLSAVAGQAAFAAWKRTPPAELLNLGRDGSGPANAYNAELIELANRKIQELAILNKISEAVISTLDLPELLKLALEQSLIAVGANVGSIMLLDDLVGKLTIKASKGLDRRVVESASLALGEGIAGWVAENGHPVLVHDAKNDARFRMHRYRDDITSAMSIPLKARGRVIGVLNASTTQVGRRYGPREVEFMSLIANQVAMGLDNARLYDKIERRSEELASLLQLSEAITSTLELKKVLSLLVTRFRAMAQVDACALLYFDADRGRFRCLDGQGLTGGTRKSRYYSLALPMAAQALEKGQPVLCDIAPGSECWTQVADEEGFSSAICVPLTASGRVVGAAALFSAAQRAFSRSELETMAALGALAGAAIRNAVVYQHQHEIARSLQFKLVPTVPLTASGLEIGHKFLPAREIGGDYYDVINVGDQRAGVVIGDITGNGVPAAIYTSMSKNVLRAYALDNDSPADVLTRLNRIACEEMQPDIFISLFYGVFNAEDRTFSYAAGGHEPPLLYRPDGSFDRLRADGLLVGVNPGFEFEEKRVRLDPGSVLVLFTDGVVDSANIRGKFGIDEMEEIVRSDALKPAQELADNIYIRLLELTGSGAQDDAALVVLKVM
ncbi:MAG: GAF domain-containing protein [Armatimonadetes bacterium]|nr:GAF domain-containing protein [Armatimonadota bacterium]